MSFSQHFLVKTPLTTNKQGVPLCAIDKLSSRISFPAHLSLFSSHSHCNFAKTKKLRIRKWNRSFPLLSQGRLPLLCYLRLPVDSAPNPKLQFRSQTSGIRVSNPEPSSFLLFGAKTSQSDLKAPIINHMATALSLKTFLT